MKYIIFILLFACGTRDKLSKKDLHHIEAANVASLENLIEGPKLVHSGLKQKSISPSRRPMSQKEQKERLNFSRYLRNNLGTYEVKKSNETLLLISFYIYGDYRLWRSIAQLNSHILTPPYRLKKGTKLKYFQPKKEFVYAPSGYPFLIKKGQSLSKISDIVYENWKRWPEIFENNKPMIRNPNLIFAGFTLYYHPDEKDLISYDKGEKKSMLFAYMMDKIRLGRDRAPASIKKPSKIKKVAKVTPVKKSKIRKKRKGAKPKRNLASKRKKNYKFKYTDKELQAMRKVKKAVDIDQERRRLLSEEIDMRSKVELEFDLIE